MNGEGAPAGFRARVRMYRHGLGDCLLVTLPRHDASPYFILIDCGVILGTANAANVMQGVLEDVLQTTGGKVDLLVATHEHWDHLSGFIQAPEAFARLAADAVWLAWTEDPDDELAQKLTVERHQHLDNLRLSSARMRLAGDEQGADVVGTLLEFFGAASGGTTNDALEAVRGKRDDPRYCKPGDPPMLLDAVGARLYVLGPPRDEALIKKTLPSTKAPETYGIAAEGFAAEVVPYLAGEVADSPFSSLYAIPNQVAQELDFLKHYWSDDASWRGIDDAWLGAAADLAMQLDSATNNTSLVIAIELADGDVLLFAADAQVGNWLSWQDLSWTIDDRTVTGPDLLKRTILYKVGHHGSHNATLRAKGLELMDGLRLAMIPVFHDMAVKKHWGNMPLPGLVDALSEKVQGAVLRSDEDAPLIPGVKVTANPLYFEVEL
ncbi:MAG: hypothetical protein QOF51_3102 [Chloroflexota bacterium]|jgi:hypothetical protein|nr:hypothetical protein [Chloroflexota bacterium]